MKLFIQTDFQGFFVDATDVKQVGDFMVFTFNQEPVAVIRGGDLKSAIEMEENASD